MPLTLEYKITILTDDDGQSCMDNEDLAEVITKDVQRWTPSLVTMDLIKGYDIDKV